MAGDQGYTAEEQRDRHVAALRRERAGYVKAGKAERVAEVDRCIEELGAKPGDAADEGAGDGSRSQQPQGRTSGPRQRS